MSESIQKVLTRVRAPRVKITYDVETNGAIQKKELPLVIGVITDLYGDKTPGDYKYENFVNLDPDNFAALLQSVSPTLELHVAGESIVLEFTSMHDFTPDALVNKLPQLESQFTSRKALLDLSSKLDGNDELDQALTDMLASGKIDDAIAVKFFVNAESGKHILEEFLAIAKDQHANHYNFIQQQIVKLDQALGHAIDEILHDPKFQALEARWRGLKYLLDNCETGSSLKIKVLNGTRDQISSDLENAAEFDQSMLFKKIYEQEFGTYGGSPFSYLIADFGYFDKSAADVQLLNQLTRVCAAAHAPLIAGAAASMFNLNAFQQLDKPRDLSKIFEGSEFAAFNGFRETEDSRYCVLTLPHIMIRDTYTATDVKAFYYTEDTNSGDLSKFCWGNAAYALGAKIAHAFAAYRWMAAIRGVEGGGLVEALPVPVYKTSQGELAIVCPTQVHITDRREKELSDLGFIALCHCKHTDKAAFFGAQTVQKPLVYDQDDATANAALSARLSYILNASRFAHYSKMIMRDKIGSFTDRISIGNYLQKWIAQYVLLSDDGGQEVKARYPLREAKITIIPDESNPGAYKAIMHLRPHFQMEELTASLRLVATIPASK